MTIKYIAAPNASSNIILRLLNLSRYFPSVENGITVSLRIDINISLLSNLFYFQDFLSARGQGNKALWDPGIGDAGRDGGWGRILPGKDLLPGLPGLGETQHQEQGDRATL